MALFALAIVLIAITARADITGTWDGATGIWADPTHWDANPAFPNNNPPDLYDAIIGVGAVTLDQNIAINQLALGGGSLDGAAALSLAEGIAWTGGTLALAPAGSLALGAGSASTVSGGPIFVSGRITGGGSASMSVASGATLTVLNQSSFFADPASPSWTIENDGTVLARATSGAGFTSMDAFFTNTGLVQIEVAGGVSHTVSLAGGAMLGGNVQLGAETTLELGDNTTLHGVTMAGAGTPSVAGSVTVVGVVETPALSQAIGELRVSAGATLRLTGSAPFSVDDGIVSGTGEIDGDLDLPGGVVSPGVSAGTLTVSGATSFGTDAALAIDIGGTGSSDFDRLLSGQSATLDGTLELRFLNAFSPSNSDTFTILTAPAGITGTFANAPTDGFRLATTDGLGSFAVNYTPTSVVLTGFIPEPHATALLAFGVIIIGARFRPQSRC
ncbi:MAG: hypothetical protein ABI680_14515 [Chthoniobacteraceae bacterium]